MMCRLIKKRTDKRNFLSSTETKTLALDEGAYLSGRKPFFRRGFVSKNISAWFLLIPGLLLTALMIWHPLLSSIVFSFFRTKGFSFEEFIWFENYRQVFNDPAFLSALKNSFLYIIWSLLIGFSLPLFVAIIINELVRGKGFFKFSVYFPTMVPGIAVSMMWYFLYDPNPGGILNSLLGLMKIHPSQWLQNPSLTIPLIVISLTWRNFGGTTLIYLASLQGVNTGLYDAAQVDGAGVLKRIRHITIPQLSGVIGLMFVLQIVGVFQIMSEPLAMTDGGPNNGSLSLMLLSYFYGFRFLRVGRSMALSVITFVILFIMTYFYQKLQKKHE